MSLTVEGFHSENKEGKCGLGVSFKKEGSDKPHFVELVVHSGVPAADIVFGLRQLANQIVIDENLK